MSKVGPVIKALRTGKGLSQDALAKLANVSQATIDKIERGASERSRFLPEIAQALGVSPERLLNQPGTVIYPPGPIYSTAAPSQGRLEMPIYAAAQGGPGELIVTYEPIDYLRHPSPKDGYAMYIVGDSMSPAFEQGNLVLVNPHIPFRSGDDVVIFREYNQEVAAMVKRMVKATADQWTVEQFYPAKRFPLPRKEWPRCHVIIGKYSRR